MPVLPDDGPAGAASFRRVGEVRAERLVAGMKWRNASGGELSAAAAGWLVVDECGGERTVRDGEFHAGDAHLDGSRWRRVGAVRACVSARPRRCAPSREPPWPGRRDWIVQGCGGERWPIGDDPIRGGTCPPGPEPPAPQTASPSTVTHGRSRRFP